MIVDSYICGRCLVSLFGGVDFLVRHDLECAAKEVVMAQVPDRDEDGFPSEGEKPQPMPGVKPLVPKPDDGQKPGGAPEPTRGGDGGPNLDC